MLILTVIQGPDKGRRFELPDNEPQLIGRSSEALPLSDQTISRRHAELTPDDGKWYIRDLKSANGTFVNGNRLTYRRMLQLGDQVRTGSTLFTYGRETPVARANPVRMARKGEMDVNIEHTVASNEDSMILAVPEPSEAAVLQLKVVYELTQLIGTVTDKRELLEKVMDLIFEYFQAARGFILLQGPGDASPEPVVVRHRVQPKDKRDVPITFSRTIVQHVFGKGEGVLSTNAMNDKRFSSGDSVTRYGIRTAMCVPIKFKENIFGVIHIDSTVINFTYTEDQLRLLTAIGVQTALALANVELMAERLHREKLAAVGQTVASLSHSIRNILQGMRGGADVVEIGIKKENLKLLQGGWVIVARNLDRIYELTLNMLAFSKQRKPDLDLVNLNTFVSELVDLVQAQADARKIALIADLEPDLAPAPVDTSGLHQALLNLINNAMDAVQPESGVVSLGTGYVAGTDQFQIRISDNGVGIAAEDMPNLFQPFYSTKGLRGTGLGLATSQKIVQEHGGSITVESAPGQGTTFTIQLPANPDGVPQSADTHGPGSSSPKAGGGRESDEPAEPELP
jgi:two-component system, NtrC family, sensor kinase